MIPPGNANAALTKRRRGLQRLALVEYGLFTFLSNITGSLFWFFERKKWRLADQIEEQEAAR